MHLEPWRDEGRDDRDNNHEGPYDVVAVVLPSLDEEANNFDGSAATRSLREDVSVTLQMLASLITAPTVSTRDLASLEPEYVVADDSVLLVEIRELWESNRLLPSPLPLSAFDETRRVVDDMRPRIRPLDAASPPPFQPRFTPHLLENQLPSPLPLSAFDETRRVVDDMRPRIRPLDAASPPPFQPRFTPHLLENQLPSPLPLPLSAVDEFLDDYILRFDVSEEASTEATARRRPRQSHVPRVAPVLQPSLFDLDEPELHELLMWYGASLHTMCHSFPVTSEQTKEACPICMEPYGTTSDTKNCVVSQCGHHVCMVCFHTDLSTRMQNSCALCRQPLYTPPSSVSSRDLTAFAYDIGVLKRGAKEKEEDRRRAAKDAERQWRPLLRQQRPRGALHRTKVRRRQGEARRLGGTRGI